MKHMITAVAMMLAVAGVAAAQSGDERSWEGSIGAGAAFGPVFLGSDETDVTGLPMLEFKAKDGTWFVSGRDGIGYNVVKTDRLTAGAALTWVQGRDSGDDNRLRGFDDIDDAAGAKLFADYALTPMISANASLEQQLGGSDGLRATVGLGAFKPLNERVALLGGIDATWASEDDMQEWFGVTAQQSARSGLARYTPESGLRDVSANAGVRYSLTEQWSVTGMASVSRLVGDAADSPISAEDTGVSGVVFVGYKF